MIMALFSNYGPNTCTCIWLSDLKVVPSSNVKLNETITISWTIRASQSAMCYVLENDGALLHNATYTNCEITCTESIQKVITSMLFLTFDYNNGIIFQLMRTMFTDQCIPSHCFFDLWQCTDNWSCIIGKFVVHIQIGGEKINVVMKNLCNVRGSI